MLAPKCKTPLYLLTWTSLNAIFKLFYRTEVSGAENIPKDGAFLLASNHASFLDPPAIGSNLPRELTYFARKSLFKGLFGKLITGLNSIPIDRHSESDIGAFRSVFSSLKNGGCLLLFPEGTRTHDGKLQDVKDGMGLIACRSQVPVIPTRIYGTFDIFNREHKFPKLRGHIHIIYGKKIDPKTYDPGKKDPHRYQTATRLFMDEIRKLELPVREEV